jgi:hypothetical protein
MLFTDTDTSRFLQQQLKMDGDLALLTLFLSFPLKEALFFLLLHYICSPLRQQLELHRQEENLPENHTTPVFSEIYS